MRAALAFCCLLAAPVHAQEIGPADYTALLEEAVAVIRFDSLPPRDEPGYAIDHGIAFAGGRIGTGFAGQTQGTEGPFDRLDGTPSAPLTLLTGPEGQALSVARHRGFGSMALFPLGPAGFPAVEARGEGSVAIWFSEETCRVGFLVHGEYEDALANPETGRIWITAYGREGAPLGREERRIAPGLSAHAGQTTGGVARIAGITVETDDPGGIALDDIVFGVCSAVLG